MTRSKTLPALLAATFLAATALPAFAVAIKHTNRAGGDPEAASVVHSGHAAPPADTSPAHPFDKAHDNSNPF